MIEVLRAMAARILYRIAARGPLIGPGRFILRQVGKEVAEVRTHAAAALRSGEVYPASTSTITAPRWHGQDAAGLTTAAPPIRWHLLSNCLVSAYSPGVVQPGVLALPEVVVGKLDRHHVGDGGMFNIAARQMFVRRMPESAMEVPDAIHCGGSGAFNYFHFALECLPKVWMAGQLPENFGSVPLILPAECETIPQFRELVDMMAPKTPRLYLRRGELVRVERVLVFDEANYGPFNMPEGCWPVAEDYWMHDACMARYLARLRGLVLGDAMPERGSRRIFLARPATRRKYNQEALLPILARHGFETVYPETLDIRAQAELFSSAAVLVGASGAAWVGLAFCSPGTRALSWLPPEYAGFCSYSSLAQRSQVDMQFIPSEYSPPLRSTSEAYWKPYSVSPASFEHVLDQICDDRSA